MKMLRDLIRQIAVRKTVEEVNVPTHPERIQPGVSNGQPSCDADDAGQRTVEQRPSDAARRLWCTAQHF